MAVIQTDNKFVLMDITNTYDKLPVGVYQLNFNARENEYFLTKQNDFVLPPKVYGDHGIIYRWLKSYKHNSHKNMGIILSGVKGGGKTITAQKFCIEANLPVILINEAFDGSEFINFLVNPKIGECVIFIDEFEKVYKQSEYGERNKANDFLSLMDGAYNTKLIFLLTVNTFELNEYFVNRLNRIKYRKDYTDLDQETMDSVIDDMLINKEHKGSIGMFFEKINMCTFDLLVNLIKEMNLFNEDALTAGRYLNLRCEPKKYKVYEVYNGKDYFCRDLLMSTDAKEVTIHRDDTYYLPEENEDDYSVKIKLDNATVIKQDANNFILIYENLKFKLQHLSFTSVF